MKTILDGVYLISKKLFVENVVPGYNPFGDKTEGKYIEWNPNRSKLGAAVMKKIKLIPIHRGSKILYLGAAHGYTCSKIVPIIGDEGIIYAVEFSERCFNELLPVAEKYGNIVPILADARKPENYSQVEKVDIVYCDIAQPDLTEIALRNCNVFLKKEGYLMLAVKCRSIDVTKSPKQIVKEEIEKIKRKMEVVDWKMLEPFEDAHGFVIARF